MERTLNTLVCVCDKIYDQIRSPVTLFMALALIGRERRLETDV